MLILSIKGPIFENLIMSEIQVCIFRRIKNIVRSKVYEYVETEESSQYQYSSFDTPYNETINSEIKLKDTVEAQYYANIELPYGACFSEIKHSYRMLLKKYHPDLHSQSSQDRECAEKITLKLNEAFGYFENKFNKGELQ
ncbi:MAG: J domain-containing protein [bacterium]